MKYKVSLVLIIILVALLFPLSLLEEAPPYTFLPGITDGMQYISLILVGIGVSMLFGLGLGYIIAPIYLIMHKKIIGHKMIYGVQSRPISVKFKKNLRGFYPGLMALNFAMMLASIFTEYIITGYVLENWEVGNYIFIVVLGLTLFTIGPAIGLFSGAWMLNEAGIGYTNKEKVKDTGDFIETRSVGGWYLQFLKGYAGIGVIFTFFTLFTGWFQYQDEPTDIVSIPLAILSPFILTLMIVPTIVLLDLLKEHRKEFITKIARKIGITEQI